MPRNCSYAMTLIELALRCPAGTKRRNLGSAAGFGGWASINHNR